MTTLLLLLLPALVWAQGPDQVSTPQIVFDSAAVTSCTGRKVVSGSVSYCDDDGVIQKVTGAPDTVACGDKVINQATEQCDVVAGEGEIRPGTGCTSLSDCTNCTCPPIAIECGNGIVQSGEVCDPPLQNGSPCTAVQRCNATCTACEAQPLPVCGNAVEAGSCPAEDCCDPPGSQTACTAPEVCNSTCTACTTCGNGIKESTEDCDPGDRWYDTTAPGSPASDDSACAGLCLADCSCPDPTCGNDVVEAGEECDGDAPSACRGSCLTSSCTCPGTQVPKGITYQISPSGSDSSLHGFDSAYCVAAQNPNPCCTGAGLGSCQGAWKSLMRPFRRTQSPAVTAGDTVELLDGTFTYANNGQLDIQCAPEVGNAWYSGTTTTGTVLETCSSGTSYAACGIGGTCAGGTRSGLECIGDENCPSSTCTITNAKPITIKARNPRKAYLQGTGSTWAVRLRGCTHYVIRDLYYTSQDKATDAAGAAISCSGKNEQGITVQKSQYIQVTGNLIATNNRYYNGSAIGMEWSADVLADKNEVYNWFDNNIVAYGAIRSTFRGNYASRGSRAGASGACSDSTGTMNECYVSTTCTFENLFCAGTNYTGDCTGLINGTGTNLYANIVSVNNGLLRSSARNWTDSPLGWANSGLLGTLENVVSANLSNPIRNGLFPRSPNSLTVRHATIYNNDSGGAGLEVNSYVTTSSGESVACADVKDSAGAVPTGCAVTLINNNVMDGSGYGIVVNDMAACTLTNNNTSNNTSGNSIQGSPACTNTGGTTTTPTEIGTTGNDCVVVVKNRDAGDESNLRNSGVEAGGLGYCDLGDDLNMPCDNDTDCSGDCDFPQGANTACQYLNGVQQKGSVYAMWMPTGVGVGADCDPDAAGDTITDSAGVVWPNCKGRFYGCGPIVAGVNSANNQGSGLGFGRACADAHELLNILGDDSGCPFADIVCGTDGSTTTTTVTTTTAPTTTTTLSGVEDAPNCASSFVVAFRLEEVSGTRANLAGTTCDPDSECDLNDTTTSVTQYTASYKEGSAGADVVNTTSVIQNYPASTDYRFSGNVSIGGWLRYPTGGAANSYIVFGVMPSDKLTGYRLATDGAVPPKPRLIIGDGTAKHECDAPSALAADTWTHVGASYDDATNDVELYIDGAAVTESGSCAPTTMAIPTSGTMLRLGATSSGWEGQVDMLYVANQVLTAAEHAKMGSCGVTGIHCKCDSGTPANYAACDEHADCGGSGLCSCTTPACGGTCKGQLAAATLSACNACP